MTAGPPGRGRDGVADDLGQLAGRGDRAGRDDSPGDPTGPPVLAVAREKPGQLRRIPLVDDVRRRRRTGRVHPHVERRVGPVAEAPLGHVELRGADAQVEQGANQQTSGHHVGQPVETGARHVGPAPEPAQRGASGGHRSRVLVDTDELEVGPGVEHGRGVPAAADGGIEHEAGRHRGRGQQLDDLVEHDRLVPERRRG